MKGTRAVIVVAMALGALVTVACITLLLVPQEQAGWRLPALLTILAAVFYLGRIYQEAEVADGVPMKERVARLVPERRPGGVA